MKLRYYTGTALFWAEIAFEKERCEKIERVIAIAAWVLTVISIAFALSGCVESITVRGQYADYKITPHKPVIINEK